MNIDYHRHCQATVLSANGTGNGNGATWPLIRDLSLPNLDDNWLSYFSTNQKNITQDIQGILYLINDVAGWVNAITGRDISLTIEGQPISFHTLVQKSGEITSVTLPRASDAKFGVVKIGSGIQSSSGTISLKPATTTQIGGVKVGTGLTTDANGTLSVSGIRKIIGGDNIVITPSSGTGEVTISSTGGGGGSGGTTETWIFEDLDGYTLTKNVVIGVQDEFDITKALITLSSNSYSHNGIIGTPWGPDEPTPTVKIGNKTLTVNVDYTVGYANNSGVISTTEGKLGTCSIIGKGDYSGSKTVTFNISLIAEDNDISNASVTLNPTSYSHTGKYGEEWGPDTPTPTVKMGDKTLVNGVDYTIAYTNNSGTIINTESKTGTCTIIGSGYYIGNKSIDFDISLENSSYTDWTKIDEILPTLKVGDELYAPSAWGFDSIIFEVVDIGHVPVNKTRNLTLQTKYRLTETGGRDYVIPFSTEKLNLIWKNSIVKSWLNDESVPTTIRGNFLGSFLLDQYGHMKTENDLVQAQAFLSSISRPSLSTYTASSSGSTESDCKAWLPSFSQMGGGTSESSFGIENQCFDKYTEIDSTISTFKRQKGGQYWTRSIYDNPDAPGRVELQTIWCVTISGSIDSGQYNYNGYCVAPCITFAWNGSDTKSWHTIKTFNHTYELSGSLTIPETATKIKFDCQTYGIGTSKRWAILNKDNTEVYRTSAVSDRTSIYYESDKPFDFTTYEMTTTQTGGYIITGTIQAYY